eukprot:6343839-Lingulodinium_polyedra.AAC.1
MEMWASARDQAPDAALLALRGFVLTRTRNHAALGRHLRGSNSLRKPAPATTWSLGPGTL